MSENVELLETVTLLKQQRSSLSDKYRTSENLTCRNCSADLSIENGDLSERFISSKESSDRNLTPSTSGLPCMMFSEKGSDGDVSLKAQVLMQVTLFTPVILDFTQLMLNS